MRRKIRIGDKRAMTGGPLRDANNRVNPDSPLLKSAAAIMLAKDGDVGPLIERLRQLALRLSKDPIAFGEIVCAADLLEKAVKRRSRGHPEQLSTKILEEVVNRFCAAREGSKDLESMTRRQRSGQVHREAAQHFGVSTEYIRRLRRRYAERK